MARSQETYSKKENEKKRLKKQQDKIEKREERKANSNKGKSLDDMLAYLDEDGNLSSTPPDPRKKRIVKSEDMQISNRVVDVIRCLDREIGRGVDAIPRGRCAGRAMVYGVRERGHQISPIVSRFNRVAAQKRRAGCGGCG